MHARHDTHHYIYAPRNLFLFARNLRIYYQHENLQLFTLIRNSSALARYRDSVRCQWENFPTQHLYEFHFWCSVTSFYLLWSDRNRLHSIASVSFAIYTHTRLPLVHFSVYSLTFAIEPHRNTIFLKKFYAHSMNELTEHCSSMFIIHHSRCLHDFYYFSFFRLCVCLHFFSLVHLFANAVVFSFCAYVKVTRFCGNLKPSTVMNAYQIAILCICILNEHSAWMRLDIAAMDVFLLNFLSFIEFCQFFNFFFQISWTFSNILNFSRFFHSFPFFLFSNFIFKFYF